MKTVRVQMLMEGCEVAAIDDMRFRERIGSRAEAIRQLIARGLDCKISATPGPEGADIQSSGANPGAENDDADEVVACRRNLVGVGNPVSGGPSEYGT